jgi:hypothetical protein
MDYKYGKLPARENPHAIRFADFVDKREVLPAVPAVFGREKEADAAGMLANDQFGCCVFSGAAHETRLWSREGSGAPVSFTDANVLADYGAVTGFHADDPSTDQGTDMGAAAKYRMSTGIVDASGTRHKVAAALALHPRDWDQLMVGAYLFDAVGFGFEVPNTINDQFDRQVPWDVVPNAKIVGGHYVAVFGRNSKSNGVCSTWGRVQAFTRAFYERYNDETYAYVSEEMLRGGKSPRGFDMDGLRKYLAAMT